jgi:S-adenosylmethionine:tRNA ribosyltransferase-isomerase
MHLSLFDFHLPDDRIALRPVTPRDAARMLIVNPDETTHISDAVVRDLPRFLRRGDALVMNDTRVIPARLYGLRVRGEAQAKIEVLLHQRLSADEWLAFARPAKKLQKDDVIFFKTLDDSNAVLSAQVVEKGMEGEVTLQFDVTGVNLDMALLRFGELPLPPYIAGKRSTDAQDKNDYQTIYADKSGAVAAPTAGLHFTPELLKALDEAGVSRHTVTLHVGAGTFLPVKTEDVHAHVMHSEWGQVDDTTARALNHVREQGGRIIAVGTTSLRLLESAAQGDGRINAFHGTTDIFITPGYRFKVVDVLMTNFHLPKSTLFMLVSAFCGLETMHEAYAYAIENGYRFYSYGDASLLFLKN